MYFTSVKGCAAICMQFLNKSFLFLCCHLRHGEDIGRNLDRLNEYEKIESEIKFNCEEMYPEDIKDHKFVSERFDYCWLLGDLNFRIEGEKDEVTKIVTEQSPDLLDENVEIEEDLQH